MNYASTVSHNFRLKVADSFPMTGNGSYLIIMKMEEGIGHTSLTLTISWELGFN